MDNSKYTFFWGMHFSQWYPSKFKINNIEFKTAEHYMMWHKALLFNDDKIAEMILEAENPDDVRWLGRQIKNFNESTWIAQREKIVYKGSRAKFTQNPDLFKVLMDTDDTLIVEASPEDFNWGIGLTEEEAKLIPEEQWPGTNLLGKILTQLREDFKTKPPLDEVERNKRLLKLIVKLNQDEDIESIELLKTMVELDSLSMQKSFEIMTQSTPLSALFGLKKLSDGFKKE
jgi:hypothetical protein